MSFDPGKLAVLAYANSFSLWHYDTEDEADQLVAPGYFDEIAKLLRRGDLIFASHTGTGTNTVLLLVTRVIDSSVTIESLKANGAGDLAALRDVRIQKAEADQVLTYDGDQWVNRPNSGAVADAHAAIRGNPHGTCATDVGAIPVGEKGQPDGVASLDADGCVPAAQLRSLALAHLQEIVASRPEIGDVIKFDGQTWVTGPEAGVAGDAFAASHLGSVGTAHGAASVNAAGFMSAEDKQKLDGIAELAEPNPPSASDAEATQGDESGARTFTPAQIKLAIDTRLDRWGASVHIPNSQLAPVQTGTFKGRVSPGSGDVEDLSAGEARRLLNVEDGAVAAGVVGDVHARAIGNPHCTTASDIGAVPLAEKGAPGGVPTLDDNGKVPAGQLPPVTAGSVASVFGRTGAITAQAGDYSADQIADTATKVLMTAEERSKLSSVENGATTAGVAGDAFASVHAGAGGTAHAAATSTAAGFLSAADKEKLDGIAPSAAPNPALATQEEVAAGTGTDPRLLTPALIKQAVITHAPPAAADTVTNVALANMAAARIKGRATGAGIGDPQDLTPVQVRAIINVADGATAAGALGDSHASAIGNPHQTSADQVGAVPAAEKGVANGVATLDATGKVPATQLPPGSGSAIASVFGRTGAIVAQPADYTAEQIADTATKVLMTAEERSKLSRIEPGATAAGRAGDAFAATHPGSGGTAHAGASSTEAGFMSAVDKQKLDGIAPSAAPNPPLATPEEIAAATGMEPRLLAPAQIKQAVVTHAPLPAPDTIDNVALANMAAARLKGRAAGAGTGDPQDLTPAQARALLNVADGATAAGALGDSHASAIGNPHQTSAEQVGAVPMAEKGAANGVATLDETGKVPATQLPPGSGSAIASVFGRTGAIVARPADYTAEQVGAVPTAEKGAANGVATLDATGKVPAAQLPPGSGSPIPSVFGRTGAVVAQSGDYNAGQIAETANAKIMTAAERSKLVGVVSVGCTACEWYSNDPTLANNGLKGSNTALQNKAALTDLFTRMNSTGADRKKLWIKGVDQGIYDIIGSLSPSGRAQGAGWTVGEHMVINFGNTRFNLTGGRADYNQMTQQSGGAWVEYDTFSANPAKPYPLDSDILDAGGKYKKFAVFFDLRNCLDIVTEGKLYIQGNNAAGLIGVGSSGGGGTESCAKKGSFSHVSIANMAMGIFGDDAGDGQADNFTSSFWEHINFQNCGRAFVIASNHGDAMYWGQAQIINTDSSYLWGTYMSIGSCFIISDGPEQQPVGSAGWKPAPKGIEVGTACLDIGLIYGRQNQDRAGYAVINIADQATLNVGILHNDLNHVSQSGAYFTMCRDDRGHASTRGTLTLGGMSGRCEGSPAEAILGVAAVAGANRFAQVRMIGRSAATMVPLKVIPDYTQTSIGGASSGAFEHFDTWSGRTGRQYRKIVNGALANA